MDLIQMENVAFHFGRHSNSMLFKNVNGKLQAGQVVVIEGSNGSGKTTLLKLLAGVLNPSDGIIHRRVQAQETGMSLVKAGVLPRWTVTESIAFWANRLKPQKARVQTMVERLGLVPYLSMNCGSLSSGWLKRLSFVRLLMIHRRLILIDELGTFLDSQGRAVIFELLKGEVDGGASLVFTSQEPILEWKNVKWMIREGTVRC